MNQNKFLFILLIKLSKIKKISDNFKIKSDG